MSGDIQLERDGAVARVVVANAGKLNAMSRAMWRRLRAVFQAIQADEGVRCVIVRGQDGTFCAGGDIAEYPAFRFDPASLCAFHEQDVWGGLQALLDCDVPVIAAIEGQCMGAGVEIASCCDIRVAAGDARFGAPIGKLGFPMAPREAALVARVAGDATAREMLLEAAVLDAPELKARGFLHRVLPAGEVQEHARQQAQRIASLAPRAARLNKQTLRALNQPLAPIGYAPPAIENIVKGAYDYADSAEHREGIAAFLDKRRPRF